MSVMRCIRWAPALGISARCNGLRSISRLNLVQPQPSVRRLFSEQPNASQSSPQPPPSTNVPPVTPTPPLASSNAGGGSRPPPRGSNSSYAAQQRFKGVVAMGGGIVIGAVIGLALDWMFTGQQPPSAEAEKDKEKKLPEYTMEEVAKHRTPEAGIWVTYQGNVYDITKFVATHPGGTEKIMLAAGTSLEPFWSMYQQHNTDQVKRILSQYLIGHVKGYKAVQPSGEDPFLNDPHSERHPALRVITPKPFNAETPPAALSTPITPTELFYIRNHLPVPVVDEKAYRLEIAGEGVREVTLTLDQLRTKFKKHTVVATLQCAGNRRHELAEHKSIRGLDWHIGAIGTAEWGGVLLRDVLEYAGMQPDVTHVKLQGIEHVQFEGLDKDPTGATYGASIPVDKAIDSQAEVLLAFEMNGKPLSRDHGFPVRVIVPGVVGARHVKWLRKIAPSRHESQSHWQQKDYKSFAPGVDWDSVDWKDAPAIQDMPVQSAITEPSTGKALDHDTEQIAVKGYAWSGAGRDIIRVDVSADGGKTWSPASIQRPQQAPGHVWGTTPFSILVDIPDPKATDIELVCKAVDSSYNTQPDSIPSVWNLRGVVNNAWHRVHVKRGAGPNAQPASAMEALTGSAAPAASAPKA